MPNSHESYHLTDHVLWLRDAPKDFTPIWYVEHFWQKNGLNFMYGAPKSHKSMLRRYLLACAMLGEPAFEMLEVGEPIERALIFLAEDHPGFERQQLDRLCSEFGKPALKDRVCLVKSHGFLLTYSKMRDELFKFLDTEQFDWISFDPLIRFHTSDENDATEMSNVIRVMEALKMEHGVGCVHHTGKGSTWGMTTGQKARGSSTIPGAADVSIHLERIGKTPEHLIEFESKSIKELEKLTVVLDEDTLLWSRQQKVTDDDVLQLIHGNPGMMSKSVAEVLNLSTSMTSRLCNALEKAGKLHHEVGKRGAKHYFTTT